MALHAAEQRCLKCGPRAKCDQCQRDGERGEKEEVPTNYRRSAVGKGALAPTTLHVFLPSRYYQIKFGNKIKSAIESSMNHT